MPTKAEMEMLEREAKILSVVYELRDKASPEMLYFTKEYILAVADKLEETMLGKKVVVNEEDKTQG